MTLRVAASLLALSLSLAPSLAQSAEAETALVRSGEHDGFSRIVIDLPERTGWNLSQTENDVTVSFAGQGPEFDISTVFDKISRQRLSDISVDPTEGSLLLTLGCDCELSPFWYGISSLVIDIRDAEKQPRQGPSQQAQEETSKGAEKTGPSEDRREAVTASVVLPQYGVSRAAAFTASNFPPELIARSTEPPESSERPGISKIGESAAAQPVVAKRTPRNISEAREKLLRQIARAATQGLLSPRSTGPGRTGPPQNTDSPKGGENEKQPPTAATEITASESPSGRINLRAQSSIDRGFLKTLADATGNSDDSACLAASEVDVRQWGTDAPFSRQIGAIRVRLTEEFDKPNEAAALELARLYVYFGFGVEARQALALTSQGAGTTALLRDMATILESGSAPDGSGLSGQLSCGSPVSLWSALSYDTLPTDVPIDESAVLRGFNSLPPHLRSYLGPILSRRFLEAGYRKTAEKLLRILERSDQTDTPDAHLVKAEINIAEGAQEEAEGVLEGVVSTNSEPSAEALLRMIETRLDAGRDISFDTAQLAGAYAQEHRNDPMGRPLYRAYVVALAASGAFDQSYDELTRLRPEIEPEIFQATQSDILGFLVAKADEMTFLQHVFADHAGAPETLDDKVANATAERLLMAGFTARAQNFVASPATGKNGRARALIRAEISLRENRPRQAEVDLLGLTGMDADLLRAKALSQVGEHLAASRLFASGGQAEMAENEAWLAEDWGRVGASSDPALSDVAMLMMPDPNSPGTADPIAGNGNVLAQNRSLIEKSRETRSTIEALLQSKPAPVVPVE